MGSHNYAAISSDNSGGNQGAGRLDFGIQVRQSSTWRHRPAKRLLQLATFNLQLSTVLAQEGPGAGAGASAGRLKLKEDFVQSGNLVDAPKTFFFEQSKRLERTLIAMPHREGGQVPLADSLPLQMLQARWHVP